MSWHQSTSSSGHSLLTSRNDQFSLHHLSSPIRRGGTSDVSCVTTRSLLDGSSPARLVLPRRGYQSSVRDRLAKRKPLHIKKPLNAFMLFMKEMRSKVVDECTLKESAAINQILGRKVVSVTYSLSTDFCLRMIFYRTNWCVMALRVVYCLSPFSTPALNFSLSVSSKDAGGGALSKFSILF